MIVHCVFYWLKDSVTREERAEFDKGLRLVTTIPSVHVFVGAPAPTNWAEVDRSYSHGLVIAFRDMPGRNEFQDHPAHVAFRELAERLCARVQAYDFHDK